MRIQDEGSRQPGAQLERDRGVAIRVLLCRILESTAFESGVVGGDSANHRRFQGDACTVAHVVDELRFSLAEQRIWNGAQLTPVAEPEIGAVIALRDALP